MYEVQEVFRRAQEAVAAADWGAVFGLLDEAAAAVIAGNSLTWLASQDPALWNQFPELLTALQELRSHFELLSASAQEVLAARPPEQLELSLRHRGLVKAQTALLKRFSKGRAASLGAIEGLRRRLGQGGALSSQLFQRERLEDVVVDGTGAVATRVHAGGSSERLHFIRARDGWKIQLLKRG